MPALQDAWRDAQAQWQASPVLRLGLWAGLGLLLVYLLLLVDDQTAAKQLERQQLLTEQARLQGSRTDRVWPQRLEDAQAVLAAYQGMAWAEPDLGLSEAALQDHLRTLTARLGLTVRELSVARVDSLGGPATGAGAAAPLPAGHALLRAKLVVDLQRAPLLALLSELGRSERGVAVERLMWRAQSMPPQAELELRALARLPAAVPASAKGSGA